MSETHEHFGINKLLCLVGGVILAVAVVCPWSKKDDQGIFPPTNDNSQATRLKDSVAADSAAKAHLTPKPVLTLK